MRGDSSAAYEIWAAAEDDPATGFVAIHNIAVMFHLVALDTTIYHIAAEVQAEREEKIRQYWKERLLDVFSGWKETDLMGAVRPQALHRSPRRAFGGNSG